jgi:hypothetical protein
VVKGLARQMCCVRHDLRVKCVDAYHFKKKEERLLPNDTPMIKHRVPRALKAAQRTIRGLCFCPFDSHPSPKLTEP